MIVRIATQRLKKLAKQFKIVAVTGPRQSGKTTLVKTTFPKKPYVSLENIDNRELAQNDPRGFLNNYPKGAIIDEAQRVPELFSYLQEIVDIKNTAGQFILTGSNNFLLQENITQSLAGRVAYQHLLPLSLQELKNSDLLYVDYKKHILQGFYPEVIKKKINASDWYENYLNTYIERDVRQLKNITNIATFSKFIRLCAARCGNVVNMSELANACGVDQKTINSWMSVLQSSYIIFLLQPHYNNLNKRITKAPKLYFYDVGLAAYLCGIFNSSTLTYSPFKGALFENMMIIEKKKQVLNSNTREELYYWRDKTGHEIDLLIEYSQKLSLVEFKSSETFSTHDFNTINFYKKLNDATSNTYIYYAGKENIKINTTTFFKSWSSLYE